MTTPAKRYNDSLDHLEGRRVQKDEAHAFELNLAAASEGDSEAILAMGWFYLNGVGVPKSIEDARIWYRKSARRGEPRAMFSLGQIAYDERAWNDARIWFTRAVRHHHHRSLYWLAKLHWRGSGVTKDRKEAMKLIHLAASKKVAEATRTLRWFGALSKIAKRRAASS